MAECRQNGWTSRRKEERKKKGEGGRSDGKMRKWKEREDSFIKHS